jgi:L-rhamnose mutarotase
MMIICCFVTVGRKTHEWWAVCGPMQRPLDSRKPGEWWAMMEEVFHTD